MHKILVSHNSKIDFYSQLFDYKCNIQRGKEKSSMVIVITECYDDV